MGAARLSFCAAVRPPRGAVGQFFKTEKIHFATFSSGQGVTEGRAVASVCAIKKGYRPHVVQGAGAQVWGWNSVTRPSVGARWRKTRVRHDPSGQGRWPCSFRLWLARDVASDPGLDVGQ